jgi:hypothetical protein
MNYTSNISDNSSENSNVLVYYFIGFSFSITLVMMFMSLFSCYWQNRLQSSGINSNRDHTTEVNIEISEEERDVNPNSYPILLYSHAKDSTSLICSICLGDYKDSEWLRFLPDCGHFFHKECIATWFRLNLSCPLCRNSPLPTALPTPLAEVTLLATTHD